jgi:holo-[acyl-carrier protein] synthase
LKYNAGALRKFRDKRKTVILGIGIDVVELPRIRRIWERYGNRFAVKVLSPAEQLLVPRDAVSFLASRFAVKEAAAKALGTGFARGVTFHSLQVVSEPSGKPALKLSSGALELSRSMGVKQMHVSITHGRDVAAAVVILEG